MTSTRYPEGRSGASHDTTSSAATWADDRVGLAGLARKNLRKVFPDHWSFMLGEIALYSFVVLLLTGTLLTLWFKPGMAETTYQGSYDLLRGVRMSEAYESTLHLSFDVRGGLLLRQVHHWAANLFVAAMLLHMMRVFVTGAFRKPREVNWMIGGLLLTLGTVEGFAGYSLPDDLLSGTGVRIAEGLMQSIPVVGTYLVFLVFGGAFPGDVIISRLYTVHILLIPGLLAALIGAHVLLLVYQKHTQWRGPGHTNENVVGYPLFPVYAAKAGGFFFTVFGVTALMGGLLTINPIWMYGPYDPAKVTADSQPDWYMGVPEGLLRLMPNWETHAVGHTLSWNVLLPGVLMPMLLLASFLAFPFVEAWATGDHREHHLLDRPRNAPTRTAFLAAAVTLYGLLWAAGGDDVIALVFHLDVTHIVVFLRFAIFLGPAVAFVVARRWCVSLQRHDRSRLTQGLETGIISRLPDGRYAERTRPLPEATAYELATRAEPALVEPPDGRHADGSRPVLASERARLSHFLHGVALPPPDAQDVRRPHGLWHTPAAEGTAAADGHQYDGRREVAGQELRKP